MGEPGDEVVSCEGAVMSIDNTVHFHELHVVKTGWIALLLAAGFARVAIKELLLSSVPHRPVPA